MTRERRYNSFTGQYEWIDLPQEATNSTRHDWVLDALNSAYIDPSAEVARPPILFAIQEQEAMQYTERRVFTLGNFSAIIGRAKSKKTFLLSAISAAVLAGTRLFNKFVGMAPEDRSGVLYFDTEQGDYDAWVVVRRILSLAGMQGPDNFRAYNLRKFTPKERCEIIDFALMSYGDEISFVVIDGIADLANAINDEDEATRVVSLLMRWTQEYNIHIATVIHQNKNDNFATGHIGSSIMKKSEVIISVTKDNTDQGASTVECDMIRGVMEFKPFRLVISGDGMPMIDDMPAGTKEEDFMTTNDIPF